MTGRIRPLKCMLLILLATLAVVGCARQAAAPPATEAPTPYPLATLPPTALPTATANTPATDTTTPELPLATITIPVDLELTATIEPTTEASATAQPGPVSTSTPQPDPDLTSTRQPDPVLTSTPQTDVTATPRTPVTLRVGWLGVPQALDTSANGFFKSDLVLSWIYDRLIDRRPDNTYAPSVARSWFSPDGGKTWLFALEPAVRTHSSTALTSQDAAFSLRLFQGHSQILYNSGYTTTLQNIQATEPGTLTVALTRPAGSIEALVHWIPLLPRASRDSAEYAAGQRIGSGPFVLSQFEPGQGITLAANMDYWRGQPRVDGLVIQNYSDAAHLVQAILSDSVDVISEVPPRFIATLKADPRIQVVSGPQVRFRSLLFNVSNREQSTGHPALRDKRVRMAIAQAIDKKQLIDMTLVGRAMPGLSLVPPVLGGWFNSSLKDTSFDLASARLTLDNAGYRDTDNDGIREMPDSTRPLSLRLYAPSDLDGADQAAAMISNWLAQAGIIVTTGTMDSPALLAACSTLFDYDMVLWRSDGGPDPGFLLSTLTSDQISLGLNWTGYSKPDYDALYHEQAMSLDLSERHALVWRLQQIAHADRPCLVLSYDLAVEAFRKDRFRGWLFVPNRALSLLDRQSLLQVEPVLQ